MQNIVLLHDDTGLGLRSDATVLADGLAEALTGLGEPFRIRTLIQPPGENFNPKSPVWSDSRAWVFHLERARLHPRMVRDPSRDRDWLVPNPEFLSADRFGRIESLGIRRALAKTKFGYENLRRRFPHWTIFPSGWSSSDFFLEEVSKNFSRFLHVKGQSGARQTERLIECWAADPLLPELTITCFANPDASRTTMEFPASPNLRVIDRKLPPRSLRRLMNEIGIHVCCSRMEGFGHYINEARSTGACILVTDGPPMNELVDGRGGFLIPVQNSIPLNLSRQHLVTAEALAHTVGQVLTTPVSRLKRMGDRNRKRFLANHRRFVENLKRWVREELAVRG